MVLDPWNHIAQIRGEFEAASSVPRVRDSLYNSIKILAGDLYNKDTHFIFELIQNAEDNAYTALKPSLSFRLVRSDPMGTPGSDGAMIIQNNEVGFSPENVDAICKVGESTKTKVQGYIGEKGIGFKSVFRVTTNPHIFSNGYRFCLPEHNEITGLGYIVPRWIDEAPRNLSGSGTTIILPLSKPHFSYEHIAKMLQEIDPVTILFLSKLKEIVIETESGYKRSIRKDDTNTPLVQVLVEGKDQGESFAYTQEFILHTQSFDKPADINPEKRKGIENRSVSIAFPLNSETKSAGKVFAYLPVREDTGLPFLLNADFLLPSSREAIHEDEPWNQWLRDCIPAVFVEAFEKCLDITEFGEIIYRFIPLESHVAFFKPVVESIQDTLKDREVILTEPDGKRCKPSETLTAGKNFRSLLSAKAYPDALLANRLVLESIEAYKKQLEHIGVRHYTSGIVRQCFLDRGWVEQHSLDWLLESYQYLSSTSISEAGLAGCPIVPIEMENGTRWSCDREQPIYFECDEDCEKALRDVPECTCVTLAFLHKDFYSKIKNDKQICDWMTKILRIKPFSKANCAVDILDSLKIGYKYLSEDELVSVTIFLSQFAEVEEIDFKDIPVLLSDNRKMLLSEAKALPGIQVLVTPEALDPETGWQNVFATTEDRQHLVSLSNRYICSDDVTGLPDGIEKLWDKVGVTRYPPARKNEDLESSPLTVYERECVRDNNSTSGRKISNWRPFELLNRFHTLDEAGKVKFSQGLINWLNHQNETMPWLKATVTYFYYSRRKSNYDSELLVSLKNTPWLPTAKGYTRPDEAFLHFENIREIFSDSVPYFRGTLPKSVIKLLGIRDQVNAGELVAILEEQSQKGSGSPEFAERVYRYLASLDLDSDIIKRFKVGNLFFIPAEATAPRWASINEVIWSDRSEMLGDEFFYLEKHYPKLKGFFVDALSVKKDVDTECFARRWLSLQGELDGEKQRIEKILTNIYREVRPVCAMAEEKRPAWWDGFKHEAKILTQNSTFESPESVFIPGDGELKEIFQSSGVHLIWHPPKGSSADWGVFFQAFGLRYLSDAVTYSVVGNSGRRNKEEPDFLTDSAKILVATWIFEKFPDDYKRLLERKTLKSFLKTTECLTDELNVVYRLGEIAIEKPCDAYLDIDSGRLLISNSSGGHVKNSVAWAIARCLMPNHAYIELSNRVEVVLGENDWEWRIKKENLKVPDEVREWIDSLGEDGNTLSLEPELSREPGLFPEDIAPVSPSPLKGVPTTAPSSEGGAQTHHAASDGVIVGEFGQSSDAVDFKGTTRPVYSPGLAVDQPLAEQRSPWTNELPEHESRNPDFRAARVAQQATMAQDRITETRERSVSIGREEVKLEAEQYLRDHYTDRDGVMICQICKKPLPFQLDDGTYYVEKVEFLTDLKKRHRENYLALCPNHSAMFQYANASRDLMRALFERMEGNALEIVLAKGRVTVYFTTDHIADLKTVIGSEKTSNRCTLF